MIIDIFSSFDPFIYSIFSISSILFWALSLLIVLSIPVSIFAANSPINWLLHSTSDVIYSQTSRTSGSHIKRFISFIPPLFVIIIILNILGLIPYIFSTTRHLIITLSFGLPLWITLIISSFPYNFYSATASLLPGGAPDWLNPFLVIIETLRTLVRPLTLSFRLAANITAGHVVLGLIRSYLISLISNNLISLPSIITFITGVRYIIFELGICIIQSYIFCLLITLYSDDHS